MMVYLVRHGEAGQAPKDKDRKLTDNGKEQVFSVASQIEGKKPKINKIFHSGLQRALETSLILKEKLGGDIPLEKMTGLLPDDSPDFWKEKLEDDYESDGVMLVGHNPFMTMLSGHLMNIQSLLKVWKCYQMKVLEFAFYQHIFKHLSAQNFEKC